MAGIIDQEMAVILFADKGYVDDPKIAAYKFCCPRLLYLRDHTLDQVKLVDF